METIIYIGIGLTIGCLSGVLGIGGGVLIIPALIWLCGFEPDKARGTSLAILVPPIGLPAALHYFQAGKVNLPAALWIAATFAVGALGGAMIIKYLDERFLRLLFGLVMIYIAMRIMVTSDSEAANALAGLIAVALAWLTFVGLRLLGRRHLKRPRLGEQIRSMEEQGHGETDYHI